VDRILERLGIPPGATSFACIFPWHHDTHPSASIFWLPKEALPVYRDWHARAGEREFLKLPEVRAALAYGKTRQLSGPEFATWALILLVEATVLSPVPITAPALPSSALPSVRKGVRGLPLPPGLQMASHAGSPYELLAAVCGCIDRSHRSGGGQGDTYTCPQWRDPGGRQSRTRMPLCARLDTALRNR
jgi:hypothetical protein